MEVMLELELVQVAVLVTEAKPLVKVPAAVNCFVAPAITLGVAGLTTMESSPGAVTLRVTSGLVFESSEAVIIVVPVATELVPPIPFIVATLRAVLFHETALVTSDVPLV
jgi:hypothetical protein